MVFDCWLGSINNQKSPISNSLGWLGNNADLDCNKVFHPVIPDVYKYYQMFFLGFHMWPLPALGRGHMCV
jgi:hypothetical protein